MAYGMNTNRDAMSVRCPKAKPLGGFYLPDTRLVFRGVADIVPDTETICPVVLWEITLDCLRSLDQLEGYTHLYNRRKINTDWIVYEMNDKTRNRPPNGGYYKMSEDGYKDFGLDDYKLRVALAEAEELAA
jgi:hypothetical protein